MENIDINNINKYLLYDYIGGSKLYGTYLPTSDLDKRGVYIAPIEQVLTNNVKSSISDNKNDIIYYELGEYLHLLSNSNPNIIESLNVSDDCLLYKHPLMDIILQNKKLFITKKCKNTFNGYIIQQIKKSKGYDKKIFWEKERITRKNVFDFCFVLLPTGGSMPFIQWVKKHAKKQYAKFYNGDENNLYSLNKANTIEELQRYFGLVKINHAKDTYDMFAIQPTLISGIISDPNKSNDVQLTSIPKNSISIAKLVFNKDAYSTHCKDYKSYEDWIKNRNENRYNVNKMHGKNYDSKNMMHIMRLIYTSRDIANKGEIIPRRSEDEIKYLLNIRMGKCNLEDLLNFAEESIKQLDELYDKSDLLPEIDYNKIKQIELEIRLKYYKLNSNLL